MTLQLVATPQFCSIYAKVAGDNSSLAVSHGPFAPLYSWLKERNRFTPVQSGSEFRIAVAGLMMANKFLDEYTPPHCLFHDFSLFFIVTYILIKPGRRFLELILKKLIEWNINFFLASISIYMWTDPPMSLGSTFSRG